ncbi:hypothetical protein [Polaromonas sp. A23]|nr:hypothetical protein [Polaromonas sp. A23]
MALNAGKIKISVYRNGCSTHTLLVADREVHRHALPPEGKG